MSYIGQPLVNSDLMMWTFTGDGATTEYTLTSFPVSERSVSDKDLIVQLHGVLQKPTTDYTFSNATQKITFTTEPPNAVDIIIRLHVVL